MICWTCCYIVARHIWIKWKNRSFHTTHIKKHAWNTLNTNLMNIGRNCTQDSFNTPSFMAAFPGLSKEFPKVQFDFSNGKRPSMHITKSAFRVFKRSCGEDIFLCALRVKQRRPRLRSCAVAASTPRPPRLFSSLTPRPRQMFGFSAIIVEEAPSKISQVANEKKIKQN